MVSCNVRGLVTTTPRPTAEEVNSIYPDDYYTNVIPASLTRRFVERLRPYKDSYPTVFRSWNMYPARVER